MSATKDSRVYCFTVLGVIIQNTLNHIIVILY